MRKILGLIVAGLLAFGFVGTAVADPGPNGNNDKGLCTAYFNGQKKGHGKNGTPGPFSALEDAADEDDDDDDADGDAMETAADVFDRCQEHGIGGNPDNGRFDCMTDEDGETTCTENDDAPANNGKAKGRDR